MLTTWRSTIKVDLATKVSWLHGCIDPFFLFTKCNNTRILNFVSSYLNSSSSSWTDTNHVSLVRPLIRHLRHCCVGTIDNQHYEGLDITHLQEKWAFKLCFVKASKTTCNLNPSTINYGYNLLDQSNKWAVHSVGN